MNQGLPLISCVCVTMPSRVKWVAQALQYFQAQTYPRTELILVLDHRISFRMRGWEEFAENIHYLDITSPITLTIGAKRNLAMSVAQGEIICSFDDDDFWGPERLWQQVTPILDGDGEITAMKMSHVFHVQTGKLWRISDALHFRLFPHDVKAGTVMFTKSAARNLSYPNVSLGEDAWFLNRLLRHGGRLEQVTDTHSYICVRHSDNVSPEMEYGPPEWSEEDVHEYLSGEELAFYEGMRREQGVRHA